MKARESWSSLDRKRNWLWITGGFASWALHPHMWKWLQVSATSQSFGGCGGPAPGPHPLTAGLTWGASREWLITSTGPWRSRRLSCCWCRRARPAAMSLGTKSVSWGAPSWFVTVPATVASSRTHLPHTHA